MKTKEELNELKEEVEAPKKKFRELTEEELAQVTGGSRTKQDKLKKAGGQVDEDEELVLNGGVSFPGGSHGDSSQGLMGMVLSSGGVTGTVISAHFSFAVDE